MKKLNLLIAIHLIVLVNILLVPSCAKKQTKEIGPENLNIESMQVLLKEIKKRGSGILMNDDCYKTLLNELKKTGDWCIVINSLDGLTLKANRNYLIMLGYSAKEMKSMTYQELTPTKWHAMEEELFSKVLKEGYSDLYEKEYLCKDGTIIPTRHQAWLLYDHNNHPCCLLGIVADISEEQYMKNPIKKRLVLVPGIAGNELLWHFQIKHLSDIADIFVPDVSQCTSREEWVKAILNCTEGEFALAGVSMGGWASFKVAAEHPERITKLALIGTWARSLPEIEKEQYQILEQIRNGHFEEFKQKYVEYVSSGMNAPRDEFIKRIHKGMELVDEQVFTNHLRSYLDDFNSEMFLKKIKCPTLVIAARNDPIFSVEEHEYIAGEIENAKMSIIDDTGHHIMFEQPQALSTLLRYWLMYF